MMKKILSHTWLVLVALFMYVPVLILAFYSFTESTAIGAVRGFSLQNYVTLFTMEELRDMIVGTLTLAGVSVTGLILFLSLWETKARYAFNFTPFLLLLAAAALLPPEEEN